MGAKSEEAGEEARKVLKGVRGGWRIFPYSCVSDVEEVTFGAKEEQVVDDVRGESDI